MTNEQLQILANASRHGLSKVAIDAPVQYILGVAMAIAEVEKELKQSQTVEKNADHG